MWWGFEFFKDYSDYKMEMLKEGYDRFGKTNKEGSLVYYMR